MRHSQRRKKTHPALASAHLSTHPWELVKCLVQTKMWITETTHKTLSGTIFTLVEPKNKSGSNLWPSTQNMQTVHKHVALFTSWCVWVNVLILNGSAPSDEANEQNTMWSSSGTAFSLCLTLLKIFVLLRFLVQKQSITISQNTSTQTGGTFRRYCVLLTCQLQFGILSTSKEHRHRFASRSWLMFWNYFNSSFSRHQ